jgi:hypothetical protein
MRATRWAAASAFGVFIEMTGCGSSSESLSPPQTIETGEDGGGAGADAGAESSAPTSPAVDSGPEDGGGGTGTAAEGGPTQSPPGEAGPGEGAGDGSIDTGLVGDDAGSACANGKALLPSDAPGVMASTGYAAVKWIVASSTELVGLRTTMIVPAKPAATSGTLYVWPGVQPYSNSRNYQPIGNGILQPVLSVGPTCAPGAPNDYASWWISGQYVNVSSSAAGPTGCLGGDGMDVAVGDQLDISMTLAGTVWTQTITDRQSSKSVHFDMDLKDQGQNWATLAIEEPDQLKPASDVVFTSTQLTFAASSQASCQPSQHGPNDYFATPKASRPRP